MVSEMRTNPAGIHARRRASCRARVARGTSNMMKEEVATRNVTAAMAWHAAREIVDGETVFVGIGAPGVAAMMARRLHAPSITMIFESGVIGADPRPALPLSTGRPFRCDRRGHDRFDAGCLCDIAAGEGGRRSPAPLPKWTGMGNLNSTVIGPYDRPVVRLPGSGGAHDIGALARRVLILMPHEPKRFVEHVSFVTSPGHSDKTSKRISSGGGPYAVVTSRAVFYFDDGDMTLAAVAEGFSPDDAVECIPPGRCRGAPSSACFSAPAG